MNVSMLHEKLRELRKLNKRTISDVARYLCISPSIYSRMERGETNPTNDEIKQLSKFYGCDLTKYIT